MGWTETPSDNEWERRLPAHLVRVLGAKSKAGWRKKTD